MGVGVMWVMLAIALGIGLRFLSLPDYVVPILVGVGVGAVVVIVARYFLTQPAEPVESKAPPTPARPGSSGARRLSGLKRRLAAPAREVSDN
jgi:hypothetical protein